MKNTKKQTNIIRVFYVINDALYSITLNDFWQAKNIFMALKMFYIKGNLHLHFGAGAEGSRHSVRTGTR